MAENNYNDKERSLELLQKEINGKDSFRPEVSSAVIKRLPRYFRYLRELIRMGKTRVSSAELSSMMNVTASQIRQDLNCFGGFGQQGYGYIVSDLKEEIAKIIGIDRVKNAVICGFGNLGKAIFHHFDANKYGFELVGLFDSDKAKQGQAVENLIIQSEKNIVEFSLRRYCLPWLAGSAKRNYRSRGFTGFFRELT